MVFQCSPCLPSMPGIRGQHVKPAGFGVTAEDSSVLEAQHTVQCLLSLTALLQLNPSDVSDSWHHDKAEERPLHSCWKWLTKTNGPDGRIHQALSFLNTCNNLLRSGRDFYYWLNNNAYSNSCLCAVTGLKLTYFILIHWSSRVLYLPNLVAQTEHWSYNRYVLYFQKQIFLPTTL